MDSISLPMQVLKWNGIMQIESYCMLYKVNLT